MTYREAKEYADKYDASLLATDPRFRRSVLLIHEDGSIFHINSAFLMQKDEWLFVFSEHHSYRVFGKDDLLSYSEMNRIYTQIEELP
jgi:hypothetical protein